MAHGEGTTPPVAHGPKFRLSSSTVALVMNVAAIVWMAARITATVEQIQGSMIQMSITMDKVGAAVQDLRERVRVLEDWRDRGNRTQGGQP